MRIIGGTAAGLILKTPPGFDVRPTPDLVRQAVFNSLGGRVVGSRVLELFAGTGALGLECLSRGASRVLCVEKSARHARFIRRNLELTQLPSGHLELRIQDAFAALMQLAALNESFDLILADPPYGEKNVARRSTSFAQRLLDDTALPTLLEPDGLLILGHTRRDTLDLAEPWQQRKLLRHGDTVMRFLELARKPDEARQTPA